MSVKVLICDDSVFAQKQVARALPESWDMDLSYAKNGKEALKNLKENKVELLFLDLNMPEMDGYQVLQAIRDQALEIMVIVVSGDIQPQAYERVMSLGALDFIKKPVSKHDLARLLSDHGINDDMRAAQPEELSLSAEQWDACREVANVAMGQAADLLARVLNNFVIMPIPNVNLLEVSELQMAVNEVADAQNLSAVCQGFIGDGLAGEALLLFSDSSFADMAQLMHYEGELDSSAELELLMEVTNILIGAILRGLAQQFDIGLSVSHPMVLGRHMQAKDLLRRGKQRWHRTLAIDMNVALEKHKVNCSLLLLLTEDSIPHFNQLISYVVE